MSAIYWHENPAFDAPELNSPQPCIHGAGCVFTVKNAEGKTIPGCCRYVHPGEEGTGRRLFPARQQKEGGAEASFRDQPACVRLTGNAGFYERRRLKMSWQAWCELKGIPFVRNEPGVKHAPVKRIPFATKKIVKVEEPVIVNIMADAANWPALPTRDLGGLARQLTEGAVKSFNDPVRQQQLFEEMRARLAAAAEAAAADAEAADAEAAAVKHAPVKRIPFPTKKVVKVEEPMIVNVMAMAESWPALPPRAAATGAVVVALAHAHARTAATGAAVVATRFAASPAVVADAMAYIAAHPEQGWDKVLATVKQAQDEGELVDGWGGEDGRQSPRPWRSWTSHEVDDDDDDDYRMEDSKCTFCGAMESQCGGDHADEMRDIMREALYRD